MYCSPNNPFSKEIGSCYSRDDLVLLATTYNNWAALKNKPLINFYDNNSLLNKINDVLYKKCKNEYCWLNLEFINLISDKSIINKLKKFTFKPMSPRGKYTWLTTDDINNIMIQYNVVFPKLNYLGALPCDFYKYHKININEFYRYDSVSAILNLDRNNQKGSHWVSLFIDNKNRSVEYFDSLGDHPNKCIKKFIDRLLEKFPNYIYLQNKIQHQYKNSECGIYSLYFTLHRLYGKSFEELSKNVIRDDTMNLFRNFLFRPRK